MARVGVPRAAPLALVGIVVGLFAPAFAAAGSAPAAAAPVGEQVVSGTITLDGGFTSDGVITVFRLNTETSTYSQYRRFDASYETGAFTVSVPDGTYKLLIENDGFGPYLSEWYDNHYFSDEADPVVVAGGDVSLGTIDLTSDTHVEGTITGDGKPLVCPEIDVYRQDDTGAYRYLYESGSSGNYATHYGLGLPPGTYKLRGAETCGEFRPRWYGGSVDMAGATPIVIPGGGPPITLDNLDLRDAPAVLGTLVDIHGVPARRVRVAAVGAANPTGSAFAKTRTDQRGRFELQVGAGDFKIRIGDPEYADGPDQWQGSWSAAGAPVISLGPDDADLVIGEVVREPGGTVRGTVTRANGTPLRLAEVATYDDQGGLSGRAFTDRDGNYEISALLPGDYRLRFYDRYGVMGEYYLNAPTLAAATPVPLVNDQVVRVDAALEDQADPLPEGTDIWGYVTGPGGRPAAQVSVCAKRYSTLPYCYAGDVTDVNGRYALTTLDHTSTGESTDSFRIEFDGFDFAEHTEPGLVTVWSGGATTYDTATPVPLAADVEPTRYDMVMQAYGGVSGTVESSLGNPPTDGAVTLYDAQGNKGATIGINANGHFKALDVKPGSYRLVFTGSDPLLALPFVPEWWHHRDSISTATAVVVTADTVTAGINVTLQERLTAYSPPTISGGPHVGSIVAAHPGRWNGRSPADFSYTWLRDGATVATGPTYELVDADEGHHVAVRVDAVISLEDSAYVGTASSAGVLISAPEPVTRMPSTTTVRGRYKPARPSAHKPAFIRLVIGLSAGSGTVRVTDGRVVIAEALTIHGGKTVLKLKRPQSGKHVFRVRYAGTATIAPSSDKVKIRAR
ncbi:carboxypeptidase regulatory-like domain-containing protein [Nocardioides sp.]|uniref:carboxypeptidase regulatory-like domain-containing protein n=1 Tax=Nocardioides sp. TaxID=35761 RepID=UPI00356B32C3